MVALLSLGVGKQTKFADMFLSLILLLKSVVGVFLMFLLVTGARSVKLSEKCKTFIERALEAWMKNPESFPCRVHGAFGSPQDYHHITPDIIIWDPQTQFQITLECPGCHEPNTLLREVRWKNGQTCIQMQVVLVSRVYHCCNDHQILVHDTSILKLVAKNNVQAPFVLFQKQGVTRDVFRYVMSHVHAGLRFTDIEQMPYDRFVSLIPGYRQTTVSNAMNGANLPK